MGLSKKTFLYSILLAVLMVIFITGYFVLMLPSLYVDYVMDSNLDSVVQIQKGYMEKRSYDDLAVKNPSAVFSLEIPKEGQELYAVGKFFRLTVTVRDRELQELLEVFRNKAGSFQERAEPEQMSDLLGKEEMAVLSDMWEKIRGRFDGESLFAEDYPLHFEFESQENRGVYKEEYGKVHRMADDLFVYEMGVSDEDYEYTTYFAMGQSQDSFVLTVLPAMTPQMEEIRPVVMGSVPMIISVVFLLVLIASRMFSRRIVHPVIRLAGCAESAKISGEFPADSFDLDSRDEIGVLSRILHELYDQLQENYQELEQKNLALAEENERQEVFLRASSHQLKTPVTAALLLVDGMIGRVGKYSDVEQYLPEVRKQIMTMRRIVEDILSLNYHAEHMHKEKTELRELVEELAKGYEIQTEAKALEIVLSGEGNISTDREMTGKILDNLFSNAVQYTPPGGKICVEMSDRSLRMINYGAAIEKDLLPHIFDPFVSSVENQKGRGLGLYVAAYYSRVQGYRLTLYDQEDSVCAELLFERIRRGGGEIC